MPEERNAERLIHLMLRESRGGQTPPDLSRQIMDSVSGRAPVRRLPPPVSSTRGFSPWLAAAASVALIAALVAGVFAYQGRNKPAPLTPESTTQPPATADKPQLPKKREQTPESPEPAPQPQDPLPELPEAPLPEQPEAPPVPETPDAPDDVVERPEPKDPEVPETPESPEPDPDKDPVVEQPEPAPQPETPPTEVPTQPSPPAKLGSVLFAPDKSRLTWRAKANEKWSPWADGEVLSGMQFKSRGPVGLQLSDGARLYFDGELTLTGDSDTLTIALEDESVYVDCYGSTREYTVQRRDMAVSFRDAEVVTERSGLRLQVSCLGGEVSVGEVTLQAGWTAALSASGFARPKFEGNKVRGGKLAAAMDTTFVLVREELDEPAAKRVFVGEWADGVVTGKAPGSIKEAAFGIEFERPVTVAERAYVRMRIRVTGTEGFSLGFSTNQEGNWRYYQSHHNYITNDKWIVLRIPLSELVDEGDKEHGKKALAPGVKLTKFQIVLWKPEGAQIEIDWFELGVDPEWEKK